MKKQDQEDWINKKWRPAMGWMYMTVCIFDFILFPIMFTTVQFWEQQAANDAFRQWQPMTLIGGGLFHMAMGVVLGISAWSRGQEKINGVAGGTSPVSYSPQQPVSYSPSQSSGFMNTSYQPSFNSPGPVMTQTERTMDTFTPVNVGYKGKKAPQEPDYPEI